MDFSFLGTGIFAMLPNFTGVHAKSSSSPLYLCAWLSGRHGQITLPEPFLSRRLAFREASDKAVGFGVQSQKIADDLLCPWAKVNGS
jgi:hypothetical protein